MLRSISIFLLFVLSFNFAGVLLVFKFREWQIRHEIKQQIKHSLSEDELQVIRIKPEASSALSWKNDHEFIYKGDLCDVVRTEVQGDSGTLYYCINDTQEKELFAHLDKLVKEGMSNDDPASQNAKNFFKLISSFYCEQIAVAEITDSGCSLAFYPYLMDYRSPAVAVLSPRPGSASPFDFFKHPSNQRDTCIVMVQRDRKQVCETGLHVAAFSAKIHSLFNQ